MNAEWIKRLEEKFPSYRKGKVLLINADCLEVLPYFPTESVEVIMTDPPYGIGYANYDDSNEVFFKVEEKLYRIAKKDSFFVFWWSTKKLLEVSRLKRFEYVHLLIAEFYSVVSKSPVGDRKYAPIFFFRKGKPKLKYRNTDVLGSGELPVLAGKKLKSGDFKPTKTLSDLLLMFTDENSLILDPFAGYGSLPLVCSIWNRKCIAIEKDKVRFEIAKKILQKGKIPKSIPEMEREIIDSTNGEIGLPLFEREKE